MEEGCIDNCSTKHASRPTSFISSYFQNRVWSWVGWFGSYWMNRLKNYQQALQDDQSQIEESNIEEEEEESKESEE